MIDDDEQNAPTCCEIELRRIPNVELENILINQKHNIGLESYSKQNFAIWSLDFTGFFCVCFLNF